MQLVIIHGGETFKSKETYLSYLKNRSVYLQDLKSWKDTLEEKFKDKIQIIRPKMPCKENANYEEWKITFEKYLEILDNELILIGNSLGGIFLAKYLAENSINKEIKLLILIAPPFDDTLEGEDLAGGFELLPEDLSNITNQCINTHFLFSEDDTIVPKEHAQKYKEKLPSASYKILPGKNGHFFVETLPEVEELVEKVIQE